MPRVGVVDEKDLITGADIAEGDVIVGIKSSGVHSNGFSLVRKIFGTTEADLNRYVDELGATVGETLLTPTRIYVKALKAIKDAGVRVKGASHITGGGFYENIPRMLPDGALARINKNSYDVPPIFKLMAKEGDVDEHVMYNTYNMGIGMMLAVNSADADKVVAAAKSAGDDALIIGDIVKGEKGVILC